MKIIVLLLVFSSTILYSQSTILWQVTHPELEDTSYFLGTYHYMGNGFVDTLPQVLDAINKTEIGIFESLETKESTRLVIDEREEKDWAEKEFSKSKLAELEKRTSLWKVNWKKLFPHEVKLKLFQQCIFDKCGNVSETDTVFQMDGYIQTLFQNQHKEVVGLEDAQFQLEALKKSSYSGDIKQDRKMILGYLKVLNSDKTIEECQFAQAYKSFNLNYQLDSDSWDTVLLDQRNDNWMPELTQMIARKPCFVAVGLFHLYYKKGLIVQFRNLGYKVERVNLTEQLF